MRLNIIYLNFFSFSCCFFDLICFFYLMVLGIEKKLEGNPRPRLLPTISQPLQQLEVWSLLGVYLYLIILIQVLLYGHLYTWPILLTPIFPHWNANLNKLSNKLDHVHDIIRDYSFDVFGVSETWLTPGDLDRFLHISGYSIFRSDSPTCLPKHGTCVYVSSSIPVLELPNPVPNLVSIQLPVHNLTIIIAYRPPSNTPYEDGLLIDFLKDFCKDRNCLLLGDLNLPTLKWNMLSHDLSPSAPSRRDELFMSCFSELGLTQWIQEPTYIYSNNILDIILTTEDDTIIDSGTLPPLPSCQHVIIWCLYLCSSSTCEAAPS